VAHAVCSAQNVVCDDLTADIRDGCCHYHVLLPAIREILLRVMRW